MTQAIKKCIDACWLYCPSKVGGIETLDQALADLAELERDRARNLFRAEFPTLIVRRKMYINSPTKWYWGFPLQDGSCSMEDYNREYDSYNEAIDAACLTNNK